ncbi:hypothetical protein REPUB_Repub01dG0089200 [Reevesia pubescens]
MRGRLADFGLVKLHCHEQDPVVTRLVGMVGYMAPETIETDRHLIGWVRELAAQGRICEAADPKIEGEYKDEDMEILLNLGLSCCNIDPQLRPSMKEIVVTLMDFDKPPSRDSSTSVLERIPSTAWEDRLDIVVVSF